MALDWIKLKKQQDKEDRETDGLSGDPELKRDVAYFLKHRDEDVKSLAELRAKRIALRDKIDAESMAEKARLDELQQQAKIAAIEEFAKRNLNEHIVVTVNHNRLKKLKDFEEIKCDKCRQPLYRGRGMVIEMAEFYLQVSEDVAAMARLRPACLIEALPCSKCGESTHVMVQVVY